MTALAHLEKEIEKIRATRPQNKFVAILAGYDIIDDINTFVKNYRPIDVKDAYRFLDCGYTSTPVFDKSKLFPHGSHLLGVIETDDPATPYTLIMRKEHQ